MRDSRRKKKRDLRRAYLGGDHPSLHALFERVNPDPNRIARYKWRVYDIAVWFDRWNSESEWIREKTGLPSTRQRGWGNAPAWFRRDLNRNLRAKQKAVLRKAFLDDDWDDFDLPRHRRNANWNWW